MEEVLLTKEQAIEPNQERPRSNLEFYAATIEIIEKYILGEIPPDEIAEFIIALCDQHPKTKTIVSQTSLNKFKSALDGGAFSDSQASRVTAEINELIKQGNIVEEKRAALKLYNFGNLQTLFGENFLTVGSIGEALDNSLVEIKEIIVMMIDLERELEQARRDLWGMRPSITNIPIEKKLMSQDEERTNQEIALLKEMKPIRQDTDELLSLASKLIAIKNRGDSSIISSVDREVVAAAISKATKWSLSIVGTHDAELFQQKLRIDSKRLPLETRLDTLSSSGRPKKRDPEKEEQDFDKTLMAIYEKLEKIIEKESSLTR